MLLSLSLSESGVDADSDDRDGRDIEIDFDDRSRTQCVDGWQCGACGLSGVDRDPPRMKAVPLEVTCSGYVQGKLP